jgi:formylglycine-generating enzyme required for sulfatase activity
MVSECRRGVSQLAGRHCHGCFVTGLEAGSCPHCGYDPGQVGLRIALPPGSRLHNHYEVGRVLGSPGGFGITYLGWDHHLETRVAIKEYLPRELAGRSDDHATVVPHSANDHALFREGLQQFLTEARILAQLDHPNIVRIRHFFEENGTACLVMDYHDGMTLADYLLQRGGRLKEGDAVALMLPVLDALRAIHATGLLHRDIKPANIYLAQTATGGTRPLLLDFGAARHYLEGRSRSFSVLISDGYAPLEQYHRKGNQGTWTDLYATSALLYHLLSGRLPPEATARATGEPLPPLTGISPALESAIKAGLAMEANRRPQSASEMQQLLLAAEPTESANEMATNQGKPDYPGDDGKGSGRERGRQFSKIATVVVVCLVVVAAWIGGPTPDQTVPAVATRSAAPQLPAAANATNERSIERDNAGAMPGKIEPSSPRAIGSVGEEEARPAMKNRFGMEFIPIPAGSFMMGSNRWSDDEKPLHEVKMPPFLLMKSEVTQGQWQAVMGDNPSGFTDCGDNCPVEQVSWNDVQEFILRLNQKSGEIYRLPSESEWEYAARAGTTTFFWWGDNLSLLSGKANFCDKNCSNEWRDASLNDGYATVAPVASYPANPWGLYDMNGNVWEWVQDCYTENYNTTPSNGRPHEESERCADNGRVLRGGAWNYDAWSLRSSYRDRSAPDFRFNTNGFRLAKDH